MPETIPLSGFSVRSDSGVGTLDFEREKPGINSEAVTKSARTPPTGFTLIGALVLEVWSFIVYFSGKGRSLLHSNTAQGSLFPLQSYSKKTLRKNVPKSARKYKRNVLMPPGHPIIKRSLTDTAQTSVLRTPPFTCHNKHSGIMKGVFHTVVVIVKYLATYHSFSSP